MFPGAALDFFQRATGQVTRHNRVDVSMSLSDINFEGETVAFEKMPGFTKPTSSVAAQSVEVGKRVKRNGQRFFQRKCAWRATRDEILLLTYERPLEKRDDGRFTLTGDWTLQSRVAYRSSGTPLRRKGALPPDPEQPQVVMNEQMVSGNTNPDFADGAQALAVLPRLTRQSVLDAVPTPFFFHGNILQYASGNRYGVELLRMSEDTAVVINADFSPGTNWQITQVTYSLGELLQLPTRK